MCIHISVENFQYQLCHVFKKKKKKKKKGSMEYAMEAKKIQQNQGTKTSTAKTVTIISVLIK